MPDDLGCLDEEVRRLLAAQASREIKRSISEMTVNLPSYLKQRAHEAAMEEGCSLDDLVKRAVVLYLNTHRV